MDITETSQTPPLLTPPVIPAPERTSSWRKFISALLSICLLLFLADAVLSVADDSLGLFFHRHPFRGLRGIAGFFALLISIVVYLFMALAPMIPKRLFVPVALFNPIAGLLTIPFLIYFYERTDWIGCAVSATQLLLGLAILRLVKRHTAESAPQIDSQNLTGVPASPSKSKSWFPLIPMERLNRASFTWPKFWGFISVNLFVLIPAVLVYLFFCSSLAVGHLSKGFVKLSPGGLTTQARTYKRDDGKTIQLVPMAHVGDAGFYRQITQSFPSNSVVLMEGVSDDLNLLTNKVSYHRMANTLGLSEQQKEFTPVAGEWVNADIDIREFNPSTIDLLNMVMLFHSKGLTAETLLPLSQYAPPPNIQTQIWDDLLHKRNHHLLSEVKEHLADHDYIVIPWGAAHMPELSQEIQKSGFRLSSAKNYRVIRFH